MGRFCAILMNRFDQRSYIFDRCVRKDAMSEIEDVTRSTSNAIKNSLNLLLNQIPRSQQNNRIEVSLYRHVIANTGPSLPDIHAPIHPNHISSCVFHEFQKGRVGSGEMNERNALIDTVDHPLRIRKHIFLIVSWTQTTYPRIEELNGLRTSANLCVKAADQYL